ncbi:acetyltransferase [Legionella hackeliae]|uniref:Sugar O-acyltransferase, sialic acid O-acetyltransferase NeuD family n=1 Tax=Legionella hackeliae TaxID=449 RepID=A0A0A8URU0_LEGHA|nr:acetyltransferase [Legionella hackeliae]KTD08793.1 chloramphenicol acetyltransferase [Legionella hackeliae]CEK10221.1 Sugar O-acyltransferase, sialic acid O-acetyltransferase NeuD family [Legionella hackeliae]STX46950.1 acetyltransferase [Legionella hackeliae]
MNSKAILIGAGGHARVVAELARLNNIEILGLVDIGLGQNTFWDNGIKCLGSDEVINNFSPQEIDLLNGIGTLPGKSDTRCSVFNKFKACGFSFPPLIHPRAIVSSETQIEAGVQIMAGAIINPKARIGENTIINSGAIIEHDCIINEHVHVAPGAVLSGSVTLKQNVHIGTGAVIIQNIIIEESSIVGAGAIITQNVMRNHIVYPARSEIKGITVLM